jgi:DNA-binding Lrp family transcriptional regulator
MVVFKVDEEKMDSVVERISSFWQVTHLYEREKGGYWEYNLYAMIHGRQIEECKSVLMAILQETGIEDYRVFPTKREFKKTGFSLS